MEKTFIKSRYAEIRASFNISARKLSLELGQSTEYINQIENGKSMPSIEGLFNFCEYFNISLGEFFNEEVKFPIEYKKIINELNKLDAIEISKIYEMIKLISSLKNK